MVDNFCAFVSLQLLPALPAMGHLPTGMAAGGIWVDMKAAVQLVPFPMRELAAAGYLTIEAGDSDEWSPDTWLQKST